MTAYEEFQLTMYGNILPESECDDDPDDRFEQWTEAMAELELMDQ